MAVGRDTVPLARELSGIKRAARGQPLASAELMVLPELRRGEGRQAANVNEALRGVDPAGLAMIGTSRASCAG